MKDLILNMSLQQKIRFALGLPLVFILSNAMAATVITTETHTFNVNDIQGGSEYTTYADDKTIICGMDDSNLTTCPGVAQPQTDSDERILYPIESNFGFIVSDFVGAADRVFDEDYDEGYAGNIVDVVYGNGLAVSNTQTNVFKTLDPYGTWCAGLGGKMVKCSSEHYVVMEHTLTCNETIPYSTENPTTDVQRELVDPLTGEVVGTCADAILENELKIVRDGVVGDEVLYDTEPGGQMIANESTVRDDIAVGKDYSITLKDDGKPLYRWGNVVKRPIDIRLYVKMPLPTLWKDNPATHYTVTSASLSVTHSITNNPNDQIRPEDMENEEAIGRLPEYSVAGDDMRSGRDCYEGDGDFIPAGTLFRNAAFGDDDAFSEDLKKGYTNAWYTTTNRGPFEEGLETGPRWRLKPNKYGQDVPGLEIANDETECVVSPPFDQEDQKYTVGDIVTTTIDLLDFDGVSPLATSVGWVDASQNSVNIGAANGVVTDSNGTSINYLPLTEDFDLAIYIKGDKKAVELYNVTLNIEWDDGI